MASSKPDRHRQFHKKLKLGCNNCKRRRVKCEEKMPQCKNCLKLNVECDYLKMDELDRQMWLRSKAAQAPQAPQAPTQPEIENPLPTTPAPQPEMEKPLTPAPQSEVEDPLTPPAQIKALSPKIQQGLKRALAPMLLSPPAKRHKAYVYQSSSPNLEEFEDWMPPLEDDTLLMTLLSLMMLSQTSLLTLNEPLQMSPLAQMAPAPMPMLPMVPVMMVPLPMVLMMLAAAPAPPMFSHDCRTTNSQPLAAPFYNWWPHNHHQSMAPYH